MSAFLTFGNKLEVAVLLQLSTANVLKLHFPFSGFCPITEIKPMADASERSANNIGNISLPVKRLAASRCIRDLPENARSIDH